MWSRRSLLIFVCCCVATINCQSTPCTTPNGEVGSCVPLLKCVVLIQAATSNEPTAMKFFSESVCDEKTSTVCCGRSGNFTQIQTTPKPLNVVEQFKSLSKEAKREHVLKRLLPTKKFCGMQHTDDYFYNDTETSVDEYPWLVYIIERNREHDQIFYLRVESNCAGALISNRYVLSTQQCRFYAKSGYWFSSTSSIDMIIGLHHIYKEVSCIPTPFGVDDCTNPPLRVSSSQWEVYENQVVLFRLDNKIDYSDFIRPICLPLEDDDMPKAGSVVIASGWGEQQFSKGKSVKLKKRMKYSMMSKQDCESHNPVKNPICGIPSENNSHYVCIGDLGGPLMYRHMERNWIVAGLVEQTDINFCDEAQPVTAVRLTPETINWIIENIEP